MDNDYELIYLAKENNEDAIELLLNKYYNKIYSKCLYYSGTLFIDIEDLLNESIIGFYSAIDSYCDKQKFSTYLNRIIENNIINYIKQNNRKKHKLLSDSVSFDNINNILLNNNSHNPEINLIEEEKYYELKNKILNKLSWKEELIFNLLEENYTSLEISKITDISLRSVYNIINRIKNKTVKLLSN